MKQTEKDEVADQIKDALKEGNYAEVKIDSIRNSYSQDVTSMLFILSINISTLFVLIYFVS